MNIKAGTAEGAAHHTYVDGTRIVRAIEADTDKGYVIEMNSKGAYDPKYAVHVRKHIGNVELVHIFTGVVTR